jgi:predicted nucleic acid-binding protein
MPHSRIVWVINRIKASPILKVVHIDPSLDAEAWDLFQRRPDKTWSLVDCASFVVMQKRGINEALTSDVHFEQAGFVRLLK